MSYYVKPRQMNTVTVESDSYFKKPRQKKMTLESGASYFRHPRKSESKGNTTTVDGVESESYFKHNRKQRNANSGNAAATAIGNTSYFVNAGIKSTEKYIAGIFLFIYIMLPQYFGVRVPGFDMTAERAAMLFVLLYFMTKRKRITEFFKEVFASPGFGWMLGFIFVITYTAAYRRHPGTFFYLFTEFLGMYIVYYFVKHVWGVRDTIRMMNVYAYCLTVMGIIEYATQTSIYQHMVTLNGVFTGVTIRNGSYRVMSLANHSLGYGLMLLAMLPFACIDFDNDEIDVAKRPILVVLLIINTLLSGSRSSLAVILLEFAILFFLSSGYNKRKALLAIFVAVVLTAALVVGTWGSSLSNYIMRQITAMIDEIFDTRYSLKFGATEANFQSSNYRKLLPKVFTLSWLNPLVGRGVQPNFSTTIDGFTIVSIDNDYVSMYIRYAYPGMFFYYLFMLYNVINMFIKGIRQKSGLFLALFVGMASYFLGLWWVDQLHTGKYAWMILAIFMACATADNKDYIPYKPDIDLGKL